MTPRARTILLLLGLMLAAPCVVTRAQEQPANPQQPPLNSGGAQPQGEEESPVLPQTPQNDRVPVTGVEDYRLDGLNLGRSFISSQVQFTEVYDDNSNGAATSSGALQDSITTIHGLLSLQLLSRRSALNLDYRPGLLIYDRGTAGTELIQQLDVLEKLYLRRWTVVLGNSFAFLPQSPIGLAGFANVTGTNSGIPGLGSGLTNFNPNFIPGQNIQAVGDRISNAVVGQAEYTFGPRSAVNFSGTFGLLHFFDTGLLNSRTLGLRAGYDYAISAKQSLTLAYTHNQVFFAARIPGVSSDHVSVGYRRNVSGRMSLTVEGGPQFSRLQNATSSAATRVSFLVRGVFRYVTSRNGFDLSYQHRLTEGSGFLVGAQSDLFGVRFNRSVSRNWVAAFSGNLNHNRGLNHTTGGLTNFQFNVWNANFTASRRLGENTTLDLHYNVGRQTSSVSTCASSKGCGNVSLNQQIGLGLSWNSRPFSID